MAVSLPDAAFPISKRLPTSTFPLKAKPLPSLCSPSFFRPRRLLCARKPLLVASLKENVVDFKNNWRDFSSLNYWVVRDYYRLVDSVNSLEPIVVRLSDEQLAAKTDEFRRRLNQGETLADIQAEAFAVVREAAKRKLGMRHFDVQIIGGAVLHDGSIAEMKTGEGKTLVSTLAAYLNALTGKGVHGMLPVVTGLSKMAVIMFSNVDASDCILIGGILVLLVLTGASPYRKFSVENCIGWQWVIGLVSAFKMWWAPVPLE